MCQVIFSKTRGFLYAKFCSEFSDVICSNNVATTKLQSQTEHLLFSSISFHAHFHFANLFLLCFPFQPRSSPSTFLLFLLPFPFPPSVFPFTLFIPFLFLLRLLLNSNFYGAPEETCRKNSYLVRTRLLILDYCMLPIFLQLLGIA